MRKALTVLVLAILMVSAIGPGEGQEGDEGEKEIILKETRITDDTFDQHDSDIWGDLAVWTDKRNDDGDIFLYNVSSTTQYQITSNSYMQRFPSISDYLIVWNDGRDFNLHYYDLIARSEKNISLPDSGPNDPNVYNNIIVWTDFRNYNHTNENTDIYAYNVSGGYEIPICTNNATQSNPDIWGNWIVWLDYRHGDAEIYSYNFINKEERRITFKEGYQYDAHISGNYITYNDRSVTPWSGYYYNISSMVTTKINNSGGIIDDIWGDYILWRGHGKIWIHVISENKSYILLESSLDDANLYDNRIVGTRMNSPNNYDVYLIEFSFSSQQPPPQPPTSEPSFWVQNRMPIGLGIIVFFVAIILSFAIKKRGRERS